MRQVDFSYGSYPVDVRDKMIQETVVINVDNFQSGYVSLRKIIDCGLLEINMGLS